MLTVSVWSHLLSLRLRDVDAASVECAWRESASAWCRWTHLLSLRGVDAASVESDEVRRRAEKRDAEPSDAEDNDSKRSRSDVDDRHSGGSDSEIFGSDED